MIRIMELDYQITEQKNFVKQGITLTDPCYKKFLQFGTISTMYTPYPNELFIEKIYGYDVKDLDDGFKEVVISPVVEEFEFDKDEEAILLIVQYDEVREFTGKRIAGRYSNEGIFLLKPNEKICIKRKTIKEYKAVQIEEKMYLVELYSK